MSASALQPRAGFRLCRSRDQQFRQERNLRPALSSDISLLYIASYAIALRK